MNATRGLSPHPSDRTFLDRRGVRITDCWFDASGERYAIAELVRVWQVAEPLDPIATNAVRLTTLVLVIGALAAPHLDGHGWVGLGAVAAVMLLVSAAALRLRPRPRRLWAEYRGTSVELFESTDAIWFNQVLRALSRARALHGGAT